MAFNEGTKYSEALEQAKNLLLGSYDIVIDDITKGIGAYGFMSPNDRAKELEKNKKGKIQTEQVADALLDIMRDLEA